MKTICFREPTNENIAAAAKIIRKGGLLGIPTETVYGLGANALNEQAVYSGYAVPANAIVLLSLLSAWHDFRWNRFLISVIVWGFLAAIHVSVLVIFRYNFWKLYLLGIPGQIAIFLWFRMFRPVKEKDGEEKNG